MLDAAEEALEEHQPARALVALIAAWRECRATELAGLIDVVSNDVARGRAPIESEKDFHAAWMAVEREGDAGDLQRLAPGLVTEPMGTLGLRVERLVARGADPRTGRALLAMIEAIPTTSSSNFPIWVRAFKAMPSMLDTTVKRDLETLRRRKPRTTSNFWPKLDAWIAKLLEGLAPPATLDSETKKRVAAMSIAAHALAKSAPSVSKRVTKSGGKTISASDPIAALDLAKKALAKGDWEVAIANVLAAWRAAPRKELVALLHRVSAAIEQEDLPASPKPLVDAWLELESRGRARDVPILIERAHTGSFSDVESRLNRLVARPPDPRLSLFALDLIKKNLAGGEKRAYYSAVFDLAARAGDADTLDVIARLGQNDPSAIGRRNLTWGNGSLLRLNGARVAPAMAERLAREKGEASPALLEAVRAVDAALPAPKENPERAMVDAIVAAPNDDAPRLVYADWLTENGKGRGELIVVQCQLAKMDLAPKARAKLESREKVLLKAREVLLDPVADMVARRSEKFERGMLVVGTIHIDSDAQRARLAHPIFATLCDVDIGWNHNDVRVILHPNLVSLRKVKTIDRETFRAIAAAPQPCAIEEIEIGWQGEEPPTDEAAKRAIVDAPGLPKLRVLRGTIWGNGGVLPAWMMKGAMFARLERIEFGFRHSGQVPDVVGWLRALAEAPKKKPSVLIEYAGGGCTIIDGVVHATSLCENVPREDPEWVSALRAARDVAKELVLEGTWHAIARAQILE